MHEYSKARKRVELTVAVIVFVGGFALWTLVPGALLQHLGVTMMVFSSPTFVAVRYKTMIDRFVRKGSPEPAVELQHHA
jgi:hypothetical protein